MVTNDETDQNDDDENDIPAAAGESAEVEGEHHGAVEFGPSGGAGPVHPPPVAKEPPEDVGLDPRRHGDAEANEEEVDEDDPDAGIEGSGSPQEGRRLHCSLAYPQIPKFFL